MKEKKKERTNSHGLDVDHFLEFNHSSPGALRNTF